MSHVVGLRSPTAGTRITFPGDYAINVSQEGLAFSTYPGPIGSPGWELRLAALVRVPWA
jgi:hypothetical protein